MIRFSQFAAPAVLGFGLLVGAAGCSHDRGDIPASASLISEGNQAAVTATAPQAGTLYVWDDTAGKMVYIGKVEKGDQVRLDARHDRLFLNDKVAVQRDLVDDHRYQIYFDRSKEADSTVVRHRDDGTTVIRNPNGTTVIEPKGQPDTVIKSDGTTIVNPGQDQTVIKKKETIIESK